MPRKKTYPIGEAAALLGVSIDTVRRWDRLGTIRTVRDAANRRLVPEAEVRRLGGGPDKPGSSARNRLGGVVRKVTVDGLLAQVELETTVPARVVAVITSEAAEQLDLRPGLPATAVVKATSVMIER